MSRTFFLANSKIRLLFWGGWFEEDFVQYWCWCCSWCPASIVDDDDDVMAVVVVVLVEFVMSVSSMLLLLCDVVLAAALSPLHANIFKPWCRRCCCRGLPWWWILSVLLLIHGRQYWCRLSVVVSISTTTTSDKTAPVNFPWHKIQHSGRCISSGKTPLIS